MSIRLSPGGSAWVQEYPVDVIDAHKVGNIISFFISLEHSKVDLTSIRFPNGSDVRISSRPLSVVKKDSRSWSGILTEYTDHMAIVVSEGRRSIIRSYDDIEEILYVHAVGIIPSGHIPISFRTNGIESQILHTIHLDTARLETDIVITNDTGMDYDGVSLEVMTSTDASEGRMMVMAEAPSTPVGTIYRIEGPIGLPHGYTTTINMINTRVALSSIYEINAPNGVTNGTYVIMLTPPVDIPSGAMQVYRDGKLDTATSIPIIGKGQEKRIPLLVVPGVYAKGTIATDSQSDIDAPSPTTVTITGTIYNSQKNAALVRLKYYVGTKKVVQPSPGVKIGDSLVFEYKMAPRSRQKYDYTFIVQP